jgi:hypothetical protein
MFIELRQLRIQLKGCLSVGGEPNVITEEYLNIMQLQKT